MKVSEVAGWLGCPWEGLDVEISSVAPLGSAGPGDLAFVEGAKAAGVAASSVAGCLLVTQDFPGGRTLIRVSEPRAAFAQVVRRMYPPPAVIGGILRSASVAGSGTASGTMSVNFDVLGTYRHSQYNSPQESACTGTPGTAWVINLGICTFTQTTLKSDFISQVGINGSGISQSYGGLPNTVFLLSMDKPMFKTYLASRHEERHGKKKNLANGRFLFLSKSVKESLKVLLQKKLEITIFKHLM